MTDTKILVDCDSHVRRHAVLGSIPTSQEILFKKLLSSKFFYKELQKQVLRNITFMMMMTTMKNGILK